MEAPSQPPMPVPKAGTNMALGMTEKQKAALRAKIFAAQAKEREAADPRDGLLKVSGASGCCPPGTAGCTGGGDILRSNGVTFSKKWSGLMATNQAPKGKRALPAGQTANAIHEKKGKAPAPSPALALALASLPPASASAPAPAAVTPPTPTPPQDQNQEQGKKGKGKGKCKGKGKKGKGQKEEQGQGQGQGATAIATNSAPVPAPGPAPTEESGLRQDPPVQEQPEEEGEVEVGVEPEPPALEPPAPGPSAPGPQTATQPPTNQPPATSPLAESPPPVSETPSPEPTPVAPVPPVTQAAAPVAPVAQRSGPWGARMTDEKKAALRAKLWAAQAKDSGANGGSNPPAPSPPANAEPRPTPVPRTPSPPPGISPPSPRAMSSPASEGVATPTPPAEEKTEEQDRAPNTPTPTTPVKPTESSHRCFLQQHTIHLVLLDGGGNAPWGLLIRSVGGLVLLPNGRDPHTEPRVEQKESQTPTHRAPQQPLQSVVGDLQIKGQEMKDRIYQKPSDNVAELQTQVAKLQADNAMMRQMLWPILVNLKASASAVELVL